MWDQILSSRLTLRNRRRPHRPSAHLSVAGFGRAARLPPPDLELLEQLSLREPLVDDRLDVPVRVLSQFFRHRGGSFGLLLQQDHPPETFQQAEAALQNLAEGGTISSEGLVQKRRCISLKDEQDLD